MPFVDVIQPTVAHEVSWESFFQIYSEIRAFNDQRPEVFVYSNQQIILTLPYTMFTDDEIAFFNKNRHTKKKDVVDILLKYKDKFSDAMVSDSVVVHEYQIDEVWKS